LTRSNHPHVDRRYQYDDSDVTFYLQVYRDFQDAVGCLDSLRRHYRSSRVIVMSDGDPDSRYSRFSQDYGVENLYGQRLYPAVHGGRMIQRMLTLFMQKPSAYFIKIDTDTRFHRRFRYLPGGPVLFGTLEWRTARFKRKLRPPNIQGGFIGFSRAAAVKLHDSRIFLAEALRDHRQTYADTLDIVRRVERQGLISMDHMLRWACKSLDIPMVGFNEVFSVWRGNIARDGQGYAATHPHKTSRTHSFRPWFLKKKWRR
jgi:hypothetical protein